MYIDILWKVCITCHAHQDLIYFYTIGTMHHVSFLLIRNHCYRVTSYNFQGYLITVYYDLTNCHEKPFVQTNKCGLNTTIDHFIKYSFTQHTASVEQFNFIHAKENVKPANNIFLCIFLSSLYYLTKNSYTYQDLSIFLPSFISIR